MRRVILIAVCFLAALAGDTPVRAGVFQPDHAVPAPVAPAQSPVQAPRSLWCENVVEMCTARRSGVTSVWLSNGVRVHHLRLDRRAGQVVVTVALSGGKLLESAANRGVTDLAAAVLDDWDTAAPAASAAERMAGRDVRIDAGAGLDALTVQVSGSVADCAPALRVVRDLLRAPSITPESVGAARDTILREVRLRAADDRAAMMDATNTAIERAGAKPAKEGAAAPDANRPIDPRILPPGEPTLRALDADQVRAWIDRHAQENGAAIEVAIVGDLALSDALAMVDTTLGALPKRERIAATTNAAERVPLGGPAAGPIHADVADAAHVGVGRTTVAVGCLGPEMSGLADQRTLRALVRIALARIRARTNELALSGGVYVSPFVGRGLVMFTATVDAARAAPVAKAIEEELDTLAARFPDDAELAAAIEDMGKSVAALERDPAYWSAVLARCDALGMDPDEIAAVSAYYKSITPAHVQTVFAQYWKPERRFDLTLRGPARPEPVPSRK